MLAFVLALTVAAATAAEPSPVASLSDVVALVRAGVPDSEIVARISRSGTYLPLDAQAAVGLYLDGVSPAVLGAVFATSGNPVPRIAARPGEIELLYDGYRIVGRRGPGGQPVLAVSGYDRAGERLKPPVESPARAHDDAQAADAGPPPAPPHGETAADAGPRAVAMVVMPQTAFPAAMPQLPGAFAFATEPVLIYGIPGYAGLDPLGAGGALDGEGIAGDYGSGYGPGYGVRRSGAFRPTVGLSWANYASLSWPAFQPRVEWDFPPLQPPDAAAVAAPRRSHGGRGHRGR